MVNKALAAASQKRKPRLLWATPFCLLDTSSGASMSVRQMLKQLVKAGYEVEVLGATIFDNPKGAEFFKEKTAMMPGKKTQLIGVDDDELLHQLVITKNTYRNEMSSYEEGKWFNQYCFMLDSFKPDVVWFYGGQTLDLLIADEARSRGIPSAFYLANGNYMSPRWSRDIDLVLTDSESTANMYREKVGFVATPVGKFIDTARFVAEQHQRKHVLFVNPSFEKGASVFVQLAIKLEQERPDIALEVVEARADWYAVLKETTQLLGEPRDRLNNVKVTGNTSDMRPVYERARILLAPSLWWESGARVLAEAMLNGIPAIVSNHGGSAGLIADGGIVLDFPSAAYEKPYKYLLNDEELHPFYQAVVNLFDDEALYQSYVNKALKVGKEKHHISVSTKRLTEALAPLVAKKAGNKDFRVPQRKQHKHNLAGTTAKPSFASQVYVSPPPAVPTSKPTPNFDWQLSSKVVVLDNRAKLLKSGAAEKLASTNAFTVLVFDPASEVANAKAYEGHEYIQLFQHALLGDGQPAKLNVCLEPSLSSPLALLPESALPEHRRQGAKVLTQLPINIAATAFAFTA
jgi:glycosyltransferase involved in cell wall biosynthesis